MRLQENTAMLADAVRHAAGNRVHVNQIGSLMSIFFTGEDVTDYDSATTADTKAYADYFGFMLDHGIYVAPSQFESMFVGLLSLNKIPSKSVKNEQKALANPANRIN